MRCGESLSYVIIDGGMALLRFASVLVLAIWVGGLATLGSLAAPEIFTVLERHDPARGRVLAGEVFGAVFQRFQRATWLLGALLIALYGLRALLPPALLLFYVAMADRLGFIITAALIVYATATALGARWKLSLPLAVLAPIGIHLIFNKLLRVPLPAGLLPMPW